MSGLAWDTGPGVELQLPKKGKRRHNNTRIIWHLLVMLSARVGGVPTKGLPPLGTPLQGEVSRQKLRMPGLRSVCNCDVCLIFAEHFTEYRNEGEEHHEDNSDIENQSLYAAPCLKY